MKSLCLVVVITGAPEYVQQPAHANVFAAHNVDLTALHCLM